MVTKCETFSANFEELEESNYLKKVKKYYNWMPETNLRSGFYILIEWMKKNYTLIKPHF